MHRREGWTPTRREARQLAAEADAARKTSSAGPRPPSPSRSTAHRLRRQWGPHAAAVGTLGGGLAASAVAAATGDAGTVAAVTALVSYPVAALGARFTRRRVRPEWRRRVLAGGLTGATWMTLAAGGVGPGMVALLLAAEYTLAARWWQQHRLGYEPERRGGAAAEDLRTAVQRDWDDNIACQGGPSPGSRLTDPETFAFGTRYTADLRAGRQTFHSLVGNIENIAGGLGVEVTDLIVEPSPKRRGPAAAQVSVLDRSPITADTVFTGPRMTDGGVELGPYADGGGEACLTLYTPGSMWSSVLLAGSGMGKSRLVDNAGISIMARGDTVIIHVDPKRGDSSPGVYETAHWSGGLEIVEPLQDVLMAAIEYRNLENYAVIGGEFTPSPERPGFLVIVDECHDVFKIKPATWASIARAGRSAGLALWGISQYAGLDTFGNSEALRSSVMLGNVMAMYVRSDTSGRLMSGLEVDPRTLPDEPGYSYIQRSRRLGGRTAPWYNRLVAKEAGREWAASQPGAVPDALMENLLAHYGGEAYTQRHATAETRVEAGRSVVEAIRGGDMSVLRSTQPSTATASTPQARGGDGADLCGQVVTFPTAPLPSTEISVSDSHQAVLDAVAAGAGRPVDVQDATGLGERRVKELLSELTRAGHLTRTKPGSRHGRYIIPNQVRGATA